MKYKIVGDSCCDFTAEDLKKEYISRVPLILTVGDTDVIDDDTFDQEKYLDMVDRCPECPRSSCPSPENYMQHFEGGKCICSDTFFQVKRLLQQCNACKADLSGESSRCKNPCV